MDILISFAALVALCVFFAQPERLGAALAPLFAVGCAMLFFSLAGIVGVLLPAAWVFLLLGLFLCGFTVYKKGAKAAFVPLLTPGFLFFVGASLLVFLYFGLRQPVFSWWDEFSFWGTAPKLMKLSGELYTRAETGWFWVSTETPSLVVFSWFMQAFSVAFAPWKVYAAYAVVFFACFATLTAPFQKKPTVWVSLLCVGLLLPFFFLSPERITALLQPYLIAYGDLPAGLLFGSVLAFYASLRLLEKPAWWALVPLCALALVKDNTFVISLVAGGVMVADTLFFVKVPKERKRLVEKVGFMASCLAAPMVFYLVWKWHAAGVNAQNLGTGGAGTGKNPAWAIGKSLGQLVGAQPKSAEFQGVMSQMTTAFQSTEAQPFSMLGSGLVTVLLVVGLLCLAVLFSQGKQERLRVALVAVLTGLGFFGFQFVLFTYFAFLNKYNEGLPDFARYSVSYLAGWLLFSVFLLATAAGAPPRPGKEPLRVPALVAQTLLIFTAFGFATLFSVRVLPGYSVLDYHDSAYASLRQEEATARALAAEVPKGSRVYYVNQQDDGIGWFRTHYYFQPSILDYSGGGGAMGVVPRGDEPRPAEAFTPAGWAQYMEKSSLPEWEQYLADNGCDYIYVEHIDEVFLETYGPLFTDGLSAFEGTPVLYERQPDGQYAPVEN